MDDQTTGTASYIHGLQSCTHSPTDAASAVLHEGSLDMSIHQQSGARISHAAPRGQSQIARLGTHLKRE